MKPTLAIYGIKDRNNFEYPTNVHDHNLCLMQDGKILQYLQLERFTKRKYDNRLDLFLEELIEKRILDIQEDFDFICVNDFVGNTYVSKNGKIRFEADYPKELTFNAIPARGYYQYSDWSGKELHSYLVQHEVAHICSNLPFSGCFQDNSLLVSFDGGSSLGNYAAFLYKNGHFTLIENNWSDLGFASKFFNDNAFSFKMLNASANMHCSVPGKLMGFASWGFYDREIEEWLVENNYFKDFWHKELEILKSIKKRFDINASFDTHNSFMQNCAATFQHMFEKAVLKKLTQLQLKYQCENLYYGGGCALNIVTNTKIIESGLFKNVFIAPCCNDSGLSVGAAALVEMHKGNEIKIHSPYLNNVGIKNETISSPSTELIKEVARILMMGGIIGVCNGNGEIGPRALGNRSLIALPNEKKLSEKLSMQVKKREWYRPVAPIMLKELAQRVSVQSINPLSKFMLSDFIIKQKYNDALSGVIHANQTARIQTIASKDENPFMFELLTYLFEKYGVMALINTSFNAQGEPIVHTKEDAFGSAKRMNLNALVYNNQLFKNENF